MRGVAAALLLLVACGHDYSKDPKPQEYQYNLYLQWMEPDPTMTLHIGNETQPFKYKQISMTVAKDRGPILQQDLALEFPTPCGTEKLKLKATVYLQGNKPFTQALEEDERKKNGFRMATEAELHPDGEFPVTTFVYGDLATGNATLGKASIGKGETKLVHIDCAASQPIKLGDGSTATLDTTVKVESLGGQKPGAYLITDRKDCYQDAVIAYGNAAGSTRKVLRGANVYPLVRNVDYFLQPAPQEMQANRDTAFATELTSITCP